MKAFFVWMLLSTNYSASTAQSIDPVSLIVAKVIKAIDLKVQQLQNETIWLQRTQQVAEHSLSKLKLKEIAGWQRKQETLYSDYFAELKQVKASITGMAQVKRIIELQSQVMTEYNRIAKDAQTKPVYDDLLNVSLDIVRTLHLVTGPGASMKDTDRVRMITALRDAMNQCLRNIKALNTENIRHVAARERMQADLRFVKRLNGIQ